MTTINASIFDGLTGANPTLITRATELINDQRLTSLEPLRQALNDGTWTIRVATAADQLAATAVFLNPVRDDQGNIIKPGQILLRPEDLARADDASVLKFIDNLNHEGAGHGTESAVEDRLNAQDKLIDQDSGLSATERGDQYVNTILDDETNARYEGWKFRTELNALDTEYSASNRASLFTDPLYKKFAELEGVADSLGLTGAGRTAFVIEYARGEMAAYNGHSYANNSAQYVAEALHIDGTQEGADYLNHVQQSYNGIGYEVIDPIMYDDGSSSAGVLYEDGSRRDVVFDLDGNLSSTRTYDLQGRMDSMELMRSDGAIDKYYYKADGSRSTMHFDAFGRLEYQIDYQSDGGAAVTDFDVDDSQPWSTKVSVLDALGLQDYTILTNDDGSVVMRDLDESELSEWNYTETKWDALGRLSDEVRYEDDGSRNVYEYYYPDSFLPWSALEWHYDPEGRYDSFAVTMNDGSRSDYQYDVNNSESWSSIMTHFDTQGRNDSTYFFLDGGDTDLYEYDVNNTESWSSSYTKIDASGRKDWGLSTGDDGSHTVHNYDEGREDWREISYADGSRDWIDFDQNYEREDEILTVHYDASGREDWNEMINHDGSRTYTEFDGSGRVDWSEMIKHDGSRTYTKFDASGREDYSVMYRSDGSRQKETDYDQDDSQDWIQVVTNFDAQGREDWIETTYDSGQSILVYYDVDNVYSWNQIEIHYDASGYNDYMRTQSDSGAWEVFTY